jgi:lipopolysaccharide transport protein LptA
VTPFYDARDAGAPTAPSIEAHFADRIESGANGRARTVLASDDHSNVRFEANEIRDLAAGAGAAYVLIGRWLPERLSADGAPVLEASLELRSGHSGATEYRYRMSGSSGARSDGTDRLAQIEDTEIDRVAQAMLQDLRLSAEPAGPAPVAASSSVAPDSSPNPIEKKRGKRTDFLSVARDQPIQIKSEKLELLAEGDTKHLVFSDSVQVIQGEMRLFAGHLEAFYPDGASQPNRLNASQNVRVTEGNLEVRCREAIYLRDDGLVICRGDALLIQGCDEVRGQEIVFDLDEERVNVKGAASVVLRLDRDDSTDCGSGGAG